MNCLYCTSKKSLATDILNTNGTSVRVEPTGGLFPTPFVLAIRNDYITSMVKIVYCPMCGRRLSNDE